MSEKERKAGRNWTPAPDTDVTETRRAQTQLYLIQCVAGSYKSWELHRLEERLWDSPAALPHHPRRSGGLSHTSPSICVVGREEKTMSRDSLGVHSDVKICSTSFSKHKLCFFNAHGHISVSTEKAEVDVLKFK